MNQRRLIERTATLPAPAGARLLIAFVSGGDLHVDEQPAIALEVAACSLLGSELRHVTAVGLDGATTSDTLAVLQMPDQQRLVDGIGTAYETRDAWLECVRKHLQLPPRRANEPVKPLRMRLAKG